MKSASFTKPKTPEKTESTRWGRKVLLGIVIILSLYLAWEKVSNPKTFPIRSVKIIDTSNHINHTILQNTITPYLENGMLWLNIPNLQNALSQLPWVQDVIVTRKLPDKLIIQIIEQTPIARWNNTTLLNKDGNVFTPDASATLPNLPELFGPPNMQTTVWAAYQEVNQILNPLNLKIKAIIMTTREAWDIYLDNGLHLILGREDVINRLKRFVAVYPNVFQNHENNVDYIDLRYSNGLAVHWKNSSAEN